MIFITGDVHDWAMGGTDQTWMRRHGRPTELACALRYGELAARHRVPVTLFLTGRCAGEAPETLRRLACNPWVEIGGHTWNGLQPAWRHALRARSTGSFYGPPEAQARDIARTTQALSAAIGRPLAAWRTHAFRGDATTRSVLERSEISVVSDIVDPGGAIERIGARLVSVPINTSPDHDHMHHGELQPTWLERECALRANPWRALRPPLRRRDLIRAGKELGKACLGFPRPRLPSPYEPPHAWWRTVRGEINDRLRASGFATLLLHPACMDIVDGMATLDTIFRELSSLPCRPLQEATAFIARDA